MATTTKWLPVVDTARCRGCGRCVQVCGLQLRRIENNVAILDRAGECPGEALCVIACQSKALTMGWVVVDEREAA